MQFKDMMRREKDVRAGTTDSAGGETSVLIAEGDPAARQIIALQVMELGLLPLMVEDGLRAARMVRRDRPALVVANLELPGKSGAELVADMRKDPDVRNIPVMLISNSTETPDQVVGEQVGADDYLCKPLNPAEVNQRIRQLLGRTQGTERSSEPEAQPAPATPDTDAQEAQAKAERLAQAEEVYEQCRRFAEDAAERAKKAEPPDIDRCRELAEDLVRECRDSNRLLIKAMRSYRADESAHDAVNCAVFSIKIGDGLHYDTERLIALAMAALCHEVGMSRVPDDVARAEGKYSRRQRAAIRRHPEEAYEILKKLGPDYEWLAEAVYQEHEREQGQGYPRGLTGDEISEFAKIIGLADTYESLLHRRSFRKAFIGFDALREVIGMRSRYFAPRIIRALVAEVSVFPLESYVKLNTGEVGRVVKTNPDNLLRPVVVVEYDAGGSRLKRPRAVDLTARPLIYVSEAVDERELTSQG